MSKADNLRTQILALVKEYHAAMFASKTFDSDKDLVHYAGINNTFFIGVYPGIGDEELSVIGRTFSQFMSAKR